MVANGDFMECVGMCPTLQLQLKDYELCADFYVLKLNKVDVVFGISWLETLGPILWNFAALSMSFTVKG